MRPVLSLQYFPDVAPCSKTSIPFPWCAFAAYQVETLRILCRPHFALRSAPHCNVVSSHYFDSDTAASDCGSIYLRKMRVTLHIVAQVPFTLANEHDWLSCSGIRGRLICFKFLYRIIPFLIMLEITQDIGSLYDNHYEIVSCKDTSLTEDYSRSSCLMHDLTRPIMVVLHLE